MTVESEYDVPGEVVAAAIDWIEALHGRTVDGAAPDEVPDDLVTETHFWGGEMLARAFGLLIGVAVSQIQPAPEDPDLLHLLVPAVLTRLRRMNLPQVPPEQLPTAAGILTAAALGQDTYAWRRSLGPLTIADRRVFTYVLWLLVEFIDAQRGPGSFADAMRQLLAGDTSGLADAEDDPGAGQGTLG